MSSHPEYNAIVIGSGMGGLAFASILAKLRNWRVVVLESHFKIGGFTHTFTRPGGWSWDVGLHYVGEMGKGMLGRYPAGGAGEIAKATGAVIRAASGELLPNHVVTRILLEGDRAVGVEVTIRKGKQGSRAEFRAPVVISDAGAWNTFTRLLPASALRFRDEVKSPPPGFEV